MNYNAENAHSVSVLPYLALFIRIPNPHPQCKKSVTPVENFSYKFNPKLSVSAFGKNKPPVVMWVAPDAFENLCELSPDRWDKKLHRPLLTGLLGETFLVLVKVHLSRRDNKVMHANVIALRVFSAVHHNVNN
jgi:hypothetical protein